MPKSGYSTITLSGEVYERIQSQMNKANQKAGYRKYRSIAHFVEEAIMKYDPEKEK